MTPSPHRVASRFLSARASYVVYVDDDGYVYDERGDYVFVGEEYADRTFDLRDLPKSHPSYAHLQALIELPPERRVQLGLAAAAEGDAKGAHFLFDTSSFLRMSERQVDWVLRLNQKLGALADRMPDDIVLLPTRSAADVPSLKTRKGIPSHEADRLAPYFDVTREGPLTVLRSKKLNAPAEAKPPAPVFTPEQIANQLAILDRLLQANPTDARLVGSIRSQLAGGKALTEKQLAAIRRQLYLVEMRPEAEAFRPA